MTFPDVLGGLAAGGVAILVATLVGLYAKWKRRARALEVVLGMVHIRVASCPRCEGVRRLTAGYAAAERGGAPPPGWLNPGPGRSTLFDGDHLRLPPCESGTPAKDADGFYRCPECRIAWDDRPAHP